MEAESPPDGGFTDGSPDPVAAGGGPQHRGERLSSVDGDLQQFLVDGRDTITEALSRLRANGHGVAAVVDADGGVRGTLTDADIRRAVLAGRQLDAPVAEVMSPRPVVASADADEGELLELMHAHRVGCIPITDGRRLVGVRFLEGHSESRPAPIALVMAGGRGLRLRPVTDKVPKPLLRLGAKSIVERIISGMVPAGVQEVFLAVNYKAEAFEQRLGSGGHLGVRLRYLREKHAMGTAGALSLLPRSQQGPIIVTNGDIVTTVDFARLLDFHRRHGGTVTVAGVQHVSRIPYGVLRPAQHHLLSIEEKPERRDLCSAGIYVLEPQVLRFLAPDTPLDMPDLIADVLAEGLPVHVFPILEKWFDIGGAAEFEKVLIQFATGEED